MTAPDVLWMVKGVKKPVVMVAPEIPKFWFPEPDIFNIVEHPLAAFAEFQDMSPVAAIVPPISETLLLEPVLVRVKVPVVGVCLLPLNLEYQQR